MKLKSVFIIIFTLNIMSSKSDEIKADELTLRNQLFADVFLLKEGVDRLQISVEVLNKRFNNQMEMLKGMQSKVIANDPDDEEQNNVCNRISGMLNTTLKKQYILEGHLITKLQEMQEEQTIRLDEILVKQALNKNCGTQGVSAAMFNILSSTLTEVSETINRFEERLVKLDKLDSQETKLNKFIENQLKISQIMNEKLTKNQKELEDMGKELTKLKELKEANIGGYATYPPRKLPMEVILGLTSSNITTLK